MPVLTPRVFAGFFLGCGMFHLCGVGADILREMAGDKDKAIGLAKQSLIDYVNGDMVDHWAMINPENRRDALVCGGMCIMATEARTEFWRLLINAKPGDNLDLSSPYLDGVRREVTSIGEYAIDVDRQEIDRWISFCGLKKKKKTPADFGIERRILKAAFAAVDAMPHDFDCREAAIAAKDAAHAYMRRHNVKKEVQVARIVATALGAALDGEDIDGIHPYGGYSDFGLAMYELGIADAAKK
jgi:hypothetical protein